MCLRTICIAWYCKYMVITMIFICIVYRLNFSWFFLSFSVTFFKVLAVVQQMFSDTSPQTTYAQTTLLQLLQFARMYTKPRARNEADHHQDVHKAKSITKLRQHISNVLYYQRLYHVPPGVGSLSYKKKRKQKKLHQPGS